MAAAGPTLLSDAAAYAELESKYAFLSLKYKLLARTWTKEKREV